MKQSNSQVKDARKMASELGAEIQSLEQELRSASTHFHLFTVLRDSIAESKTAFAKSPLFWDFTRHAHLQASVMSVCRLYDEHPSGSHFSHLLEDIQTNLPIFDRECFWQQHDDTFVKRMLEPKGQRPSDAQLKRDIEFCSVKNPLVATLKKWRGNSIAHKNRRIILGRSAFLKNDPLMIKDLQKLIEEGYTILNYYSKSFEGRVFESFPQEQLNDYQRALRILIQHGRKE